jgi:LysR family transcriptional regulator of gallate degradation
VGEIVSRLAVDYPRLHIVVIEAHYNALLRALRHGDIDIILGALHPDPPQDVSQVKLFDDELAIVARLGHPLAAHAKLGLPDLDGAQWALPFQRTELPNTLEKAALAAGLDIPPGAIEANTIAMVRRVVMASDRLSIIWRQQLGAEDERALCALPIPLPAARLPHGYLTRKGALPAAGLRALLEHLAAR